MCAWRRCACAKPLRPSPLCLLTSRETANSTSCCFAAATRRADVARDARASPLASTLFKDLALSRSSSKFSAVILFFLHFCALFVCTVLFCEAVLRQSSILFFTTSKITYSPSCQKRVAGRERRRAARAGGARVR